MNAKNPQPDLGDWVSKSFAVAMDMYFVCYSESEQEPTPEEILESLERKVKFLREHPDHIHEHTQWIHTQPIYELYKGEF